MTTKGDSDPELASGYTVPYTGTLGKAWVDPGRKKCGSSSYCFCYFSVSFKVFLKNFK